MIEEVRDLLKRIDQIIDSESRRMTDQIDELKEELNELKESGENLSSIRDEIKNLTSQLDEITYERDSLQKTVEKLSPLESMTEELNEQVENLTLQQEGYIFTIKVISNWIPSQKENIGVLVALSSSPNHTSSLKELQSKTTIPEVTLKNRILPILEDNLLIKLEGKAVKLTIKESE
ncbi:MAG: hypothetical protein KAJ72_04455 [Candidatus Heimdallarchaeota archaeon]|nr:hypothetical protein [Candidatus Heimdallarchaeota archaeon]